MTHDLLVASAEKKVKRFIHIGSCSEYGSKQHAISENEFLEPTAIYGVTKAAASLLVQERSKALGLEALVLRAFGMWGPLEGAYRLIPQVIDSCLKKYPLDLTDCGQIRDYTFVSDVADAIASMTTISSFPTSEIINVGSGRPILLKEFVLSVARQLSGEGLMRFGVLARRPTEMPMLVASCEKWNSYHLPPIVKTTIEEGVKRMLQTHEIR